MNLSCDDCVLKFYTCIGVIKRNASDRNAMNYEFITETMRLQSIDFTTFENKGCCVQISGALYKKRFTRIILLLRPISYIFHTFLKFSFKYLT